VYKRQIYQIAESNRVEKIDSVARIESNLGGLIETFFARIGTFYRSAVVVFYVFFHISKNVNFTVL